MNTIIYTIIVAAIIAILLGILLGLFKKIFHVDTDPKVQLVRDALSGANCGGCGLAGCDAFASAVVKGDAPTNGCVAGGADCASKVAAILGQAGVEVKPKIAFLACAGVGDAGVDDDCVSGRSAVNHLSVPDDGSCLDDIRGKGSRALAGRFTEDQRHIRSSFIFNAGRCRRGFKTLRGCDAAFDLLHLQSSVSLSLSINLVIFAWLSTNS